MTEYKCAWCDQLAIRFARVVWAKPILVPLCEWCDGKHEATALRCSLEAGDAILAAIEVHES